MRRCSGSPCRAYLVLQCPQPSPQADAGIWLPCSGPCDVGTYGRRNRQQI
ncbi:unnamed protein product [Staurois parvus]|uniref:Uncharacterized protein n=1 Tax=Staurois parvus TaxID=386267 RepID=A0ABN9CQX3_9NEOB|nr:unnamed protein product [Staurois parvus]